MAYLHIRPPHAQSIRSEIVGHSILGRAIECDVWINDPRLSRMHCRVEQDGGVWFVTDLNSRNGTFVAGRRIEDRHALVDGDEFEIGDTRVTFHDRVLTERPKDPMAAGLSDSGMGMEIGGSTGHPHHHDHGPGETMSGSRFATHATIVRPATGAAANPADSTVAGAVPAAHKAAPAAFRRPPATPKVGGETVAELRATGRKNNLSLPVLVVAGVAVVALLGLWLYLLL